MLELISKYLGAIVTTSSGIVFVRYILGEKIKLNKFYMLLLVLLNTLIAQTLYVLEVGAIRSIVGYFLYVILFKLVFKTNINKSFLISFIFYVLLFSSEIFVFLFVPAIFKGSLDYIFNSIGNMFFTNLIISMFLLLFSCIFKPWLIKLSNIRVKFSVVVYWILSFVSILLFFFLAFKSDALSLGTYLALGIIVVMLIVVFNLFMQAHRNDELTIKYDKMLEFIKKYEVEIDNQRTFRHETKNQLLTIKSKLIDADKTNNIVDYIDEIIKDNNRIINHSEYAKLRYLPSNGIKGLFYFKVSEAIENEINVNINISRNIEKSFLKKLNSNMFNQLGKILGIFLDNAIEGALESSDKKMGIEVYLDNEDVHFIISNTFVSRNISKGYGRGHGLLLARTIIDNNSRFSNLTEVTDNLYIQKLVIKK